MKKEEVLAKVIEKAVKNGWKNKDGWNLEEIEHDYDKTIIFGLIFSHDFAKALWGKEEIEVEIVEDFLGKKTNDHIFYMQKAYKFHLQQLAISTDRIKYLEKFI